MSKQQTIYTAWPLYLTIAVAGAASMATSSPDRPFWREHRFSQGPLVRLDETRAGDAADFTVHLSHEDTIPPGYSGSPHSFVDVLGVVSYELDGAPQYLRIALATAGQTVLGEQVHLLEGAGQFSFRATSDEPRACAPAGAEVCEQTFTVMFDAEDVDAGVIDIEWYVVTEAQGAGEVPPADFVLDVDIEGGQPVDGVPPLLSVAGTTDEPGDGRWLWSDEAFEFLHTGPLLGGNSKHFTIRGAGGFTSSLLSLVASIESSNGPVPATFLLTVIPDESASGPVAEQAITFAGDTGMTVELQIPQPLDCPPGRACERGYTIILDGPDDITGNANAHFIARALIEGEGEQPPADAQVVLTIDPADPI